MDFLSDALANGRRFRILALVDDFTRISPGILVHPSIPAGKVTFSQCDNAFVESFIGKLRDECLNEHWFLNQAHAQQIIEAWRENYNTERPHSSLNNLTPYEFIKEQTIPLQE